MKNYIYDRGWEYRRIPTDKALDNADDDSRDGTTAREYYEEFGGEYWFYWLRSPYASNSSMVRDVDYSGVVYWSNAQSGGGGIVPALNLKSGIYTSDGNGSINNPYKFIGVADIKPTHR